MSSVLKILLLIFGVQWLEIRGTPLFQGISFQKGFELNFKPFPFKPFEFIKEKWSPFGVFGQKFAIQKRSLDDIVPPQRVPRPAAPVFEHIDEIETIGTGPLFILPKPVPKPIVVPAPIMSPVPLPPKPEVLPVPLPIIVNDLPPLPEKPREIPSISTNMVIIQPGKVINTHMPSGLYTDITRVESVKEHIDSAKPAPLHLEHEILKPIEPIPPVLPPEPIKHVPAPVDPILEPAPVPIEPIPQPIEPVLEPVSEVVPPPSAEPVPEPPPIPVPPPVVEHVPPPPVPSEVAEPIPDHKKEEKKEILLKDSTFIKGSKMALQFGTVFLTLMAQFFDNARATIDQMTNPPPTFAQ